ncbi:MAG: PKD domain-containing protein [Candidatus Peregrinibacteria bacterium]|nr:PKD domain-containing protein [Candidatus Peregrinibacteria bacterium]MDZ4244907.1 PKD domain-containing protein [Candidatus Gracilibacteria bacterium]
MTFQDNNINPGDGTNETNQPAEAPVPKIDNSSFRKQPIARTENISPKVVQPLVPVVQDELIPVIVQTGSNMKSEKKEIADPHLPVANVGPVAPQVMTPEKQVLIDKKKKNKQNKKMFMLVSIFLIGLVLLFVMAFFLIYSVTDPANNPFIRLFGLEVEQWIPFLINLVSVFFGLLVIASFFVGLVGMFKIGAAPKDNVVAKRKGMAMAMVGSMFLIVFIVIWMFTYIWLDGKRGDYSVPVEFIQTEPSIVTGLTAPIVIKFDASSILRSINPAQKEIISYVWTFGDGEKLTGQKVSHQYLRKGAVDGSYDVNLRVRFKDLKTGEEGTQDFHKTVVFDNEKVAAAFTMSSEEGSVPFEVEFDASESADPDGSIIEYLWDFDGDGNFDDGAGSVVNYTFTQIGEYNVQLKVVDNSNDYAMTGKLITATELIESKAIIDVDNDKGNYYINKEYTFDASGSTSPSGAVTNYKWDFGDGSAASTRTASHTFKKLGKYIVVLETEDLEKKKAVSSIEIEIKKPDSAPRAVITPNPDFADKNKTYIEGTAPFSVNLNALASTDEDNDIIEYEWDFDSDGVVDASGDVAAFTYNSPGEYKATLYVTDAANNQTSRTLRINVEKQGLKARISASSLEGEVPHVVLFDASGSSYPEGRIISYKWNFGDGSNPRFDDSQIAYEYTRVGEFKPSVTVKTDDGQEQSADLTINVRPVSVRACFTINKSTGAAPIEVIFDSGCSTGTVTQYSWKINGINTPSTPPHRLTRTFENPGAYEVELTVRDHDGVIDRFMDTVNVQVLE